MKRIKKGKYLFNIFNHKKNDSFFDIEKRFNIVDLGIQVFEVTEKIKSNTKKTINKVKGILITLTIICLLLMGFVGYKLVKWQIENSKTKKEIKEVVKDVKIEQKEVVTKTEENHAVENSTNDYFDFQKVNMISVDFKELLNKNSDTKGWIQVPGTNINYPFVQTNNNSYYLRHSFNKSINDAGWVFLDYRNSIEILRDNTIIYGHGRLNNTMFGSLKKVVNPSWYNNANNHFIKISTPLENSIWQVFSTYTIEPESYYITTLFTTKQEYTDFINTLKGRSVYNFNVDVTNNDKTLTLSSCYDDSKRVVLHAKLISKESR